MHYVSDLHIDNGAQGGPHGFYGRFDVSRWAPSNWGTVANDDVLLVAGDTAEYLDDTIDFLNAARRNYRLVVSVLGNHEKGDATKECADGVYILDRIPGHRVDIDGVAIIGACLATGDETQADAVEASIRTAWDDSTISRVVIMSHYVPLDNLSLIMHKPHKDKCNDFITRLPIGAPKKTTYVFGHLHLPVDIFCNDYRMLSNPRGYRGVRRDGSAFEGFKRLF